MWVVGRFKSWRTSAAGVGALVFAAADLIAMFHNGDWDGPRLGTSLMAIITGLGLVSARDETASENAHAAQTVDTQVAVMKADGAQQTANAAMVMAAEPKAP